MKTTAVVAGLLALLVANAASAQKAAYIAVLVDTDRSVRKMNLPGAASDLLEGLGGSDLAGVWAVSDASVSLMAMTPMTSGWDKSTALEGLRNTGSKRRTHDLPASLALALSHLLAFENPAAVRAVVLLHGGGNDGGDTTAVTQALLGAKVPVFAIAVGKRVDVPVLSRLARGTGGQVFEARSRGQLAGHLSSVLAGIDGLRSGKLPAARPTPAQPIENQAGRAEPIRKPVATGGTSKLRCANSDGVTLSIEKLGGRSQIRLRRPMPKPKKGGRTPKLVPLFQKITSADLKGQKDVTAFAADVGAAECRFSPDHPEVVGCNIGDSTMYRVTTKDGTRTLLASQLKVTTRRVEEANLDGRTYWVVARVELGLNDPSKAGGGAGKIGAISVTRFKLSQCR